MKNAGQTGMGYKAPEHKSSTVRGAHMEDGDATGVGPKGGLSRLEGFDSESPGQEVSNDANPRTGNATGRIVKNPKSTSAKKFGNDFDIC